MEVSRVGLKFNSKRRGVQMTKGVYCIINRTNGKIYVGSSSNIQARIREHKSSINKRDFQKSKTSRLLLEDLMKNGNVENLEFKMLEVYDEKQNVSLLNREEFWILKLETNNPEKGYNVRVGCKAFGDLNPNYGNKWSPIQRKNNSEIARKNHASGNIYNKEWKDKLSQSSKEMWKNEEIRNQISENVSRSKSKYKFKQFLKDGTLVKEWDSIRELTEELPDYHVQSIYSVCSGYKKSYKGFLWSKELKI